ncbi:hypothetical protein OH76DRAFT_1397577 [Lentinus brumalis]|uniref:Protein kinase domain-containing protein n=1 Tax=Lentinus brumalis TaxID=2498619 RepID=A0A371DRQ4_9APHY|nr:hypothetical protein OH76DRAFT_1397577 [Polyporus brumalis]
MADCDRVDRLVGDETAAKGHLPDLPLEDINSFHKREDGFPCWYEMRQFWSAYRDWLATRGFYLHALDRREYEREDMWYPPPTSTCAASLPYAERIAHDAIGECVPLPYSKCAPAQDSHGRDVTIKLVNTYTYEYGIYQDLLRCDELFGQDFQGVLPPVAILDTSYRFSFIVMPTWGTYNPLGDFETVGQVVRFMYCMLKGLRFLHSRRVAHRDIDQQNIMNNIYTLWRPSDAFPTRLAEHRRTSRVLYCLFDFNLSVQFPLNTPLHECRLVSENCTFTGSAYIPWDVCFGAYDYDPFTYDVACLGNMFRAKFATIVRNVPEFALLFEKMTTYVIQDRLSASEAFACLRQTVKRLPDRVSDTDIILNPTLNFWDAERYWSLVPPELAVAWAKYRTPPAPTWYTLLDNILDYRFGQTMLLYIRRKLRI